jgi:tetratricopeptide (TPR) repeat protein
LNNLANLYQKQGRLAEAEPLHRRALGIREKALGPEHPDVGASLDNLAGLYRAQGKLDEALTLARRATGLLARRFAAESGGSRQGVLAEQRTRSGGFELHVALLAAVAERGPEARAEAAAESFTIAQLARASDTAEQVGKMAARYAAGSDALAKVARARQDALAKFDQLDTRIVRACGAERQRNAGGEPAHRASGDCYGNSRARCPPRTRISAIPRIDQPEAAGA